LLIARNKTFSYLFPIMSATAVYKTWLGTQGMRRAVGASQADWTPPNLVTKLDQELPEAVGHVVMQLRGPRSNTHAMVFQLPSKPDLFFCIYVSEGFGDGHPQHVEVYAFEAPGPKEGWLSDTLSTPALEVLKLKATYAELRDYVPAEGSLARVKAEQEAAETQGRSSSCVLL
jgi:hypothetical protein